jgi:hypothetical protein
LPDAEPQPSGRARATVRSASPHTYTHGTDPLRSIPIEYSRGASTVAYCLKSSSTLSVVVCTTISGCPSPAQVASKLIRPHGRDSTAHSAHAISSRGDRSLHESSCQQPLEIRGRVAPLSVSSCSGPGAGGTHPCLVSGCRGYLFPLGLRSPAHHRATMCRSS